MKHSLFILLVASVSAAPLYSKAKQAHQPTPLEEFDKELFTHLDTFAHMLTKARKSSYTSIDLKKAMRGAMSGFAKEISPHTDIMSLDKVLETTSGEFPGIGVVIRPKDTSDEFLLILDTIPGGPADQAGMVPQDKIVTVDGTAIKELATNEVIDKLKGKRHTTVAVEILREGEQKPLAFNVKRDIVKEEHSLCYLLPEHNIYYLSLSQFSHNSVRTVEQLIKKAHKHNYKGLIIDVRNNAGGLLDAAIDIAGLFIKNDSLVVTTKDRHNKVLQTYKTTRDPITNGSLPIFILMNHYTASAAEILAGALKAHSEKLARSTKHSAHQPLMVFLVGTQTHGKGSVQEVIPIGDDVALKLTHALYYLPDDTTIQAVGITPDIEIKRKLPLPDQAEWLIKHYGRESSHPHHITVGKVEKTTDKKDDQKKWREKRKDALRSDVQIQGAINLVNLYDLGQKAHPEKVATRPKALAFLKHHFANDQFTLKEVTI